MTRLGPLTSEALGRSPFDIFVPGTGEPDPRAPPQTYDEHGRPFNSESRRIHRSIIRAHNELMQAVGVARPNTLTPECAFDCQIIQQMHEDNIGHRIFGYMRAVGVLGVWGAEPLRQRTLLFRRFGEDRSFSRAELRRDYGGRVLLRTLLVGLPASILDNVLHYCSTLIAADDWHHQRRRNWPRVIIKYVRIHIQAFICLQRLGFIPARVLYPSLLFFVPFSSQSLVRRPAFPTELTFRAVAKTAAASLLAFAPMVAFYGYSWLHDLFIHSYDYIFYEHLGFENRSIERPVSEHDPITGEWRLAGLPEAQVPVRTPQSPQPALEPAPTPVPHDNPPLVPAPPGASSPAALPERNVGSGNSQGEDCTANPAVVEVAQGGEASAILTDAGRSHSVSEGGQTNGRAVGDGLEVNTEAGPLQNAALDPVTSSPTVTHGRRNTMSSYSSESEDADEFLAATRVHFDVETRDVPPGTFSAYVRPAATVSIGFEVPEPQSNGAHSAGGESGSGTQSASTRRSLGVYVRGVFYPLAPAYFYSDTMLSRLPAAIFSIGAASVYSSFLLISFEAITVRMLARAWLSRLPGSSSTALIDGYFFSLRSANHCMLAMLLEISVHAVAVLTSLGLARHYRGKRPQLPFWAKAHKMLMARLP